MTRPLLVVPLLVAAVAGTWLLRSAFLRWRDLRVAQTYELAAEQRPLLLRVGGAMVCGMCVTALAVTVSLDGRAGRSVQQAAPAAATAERSPAPPPAPPSSGAPSQAAASPSGAVPPVITQFKAVGQPAGGELLEGAVPGPDGRPRTVRVWLPPQYKEDPNARFPVIVLHAGGARTTADAELPDVFDGVASAVKLGRSRPFVVVVPQSPTGTARPCELVAAAPQAVADDTALRTAVGAAFRTLPPGPGDWGTLGIEAGAPCAVAAGLARPDLYGAAAAVSGRYDPAALAQTGADAPGTSAARLLLAAAKSDTAGLDSARKLQGALQSGKGRAAQADVRISDIVQDYTPERVRLRLVRVAVQYLAESLAKPA
ncbi:alpha/beta hydrolase-fold protein [Kitasatospora sp. NPDC056138]|uniref:alpha/beta hydrolase-fold protein n=1 Tax=Kitasatospora sp. NPDC056138 TaxID=3345724 RepID=UPI0035E05BDC